MSDELLDLTHDPTIHMLTRRYKRQLKTLRAVRIASPFIVRRRDKAESNGNPGDFLAIADDDTPERPHRWVIDADTFEAHYSETVEA